MRTVATAGHVDHGKSSLVRALTGTDPDRFAEEKARGLTIDLGFAFTTLPSGLEVGFVDVPGHVRFIKNMLAGVGAVEVALFVVAATEGWMPQSEEHLRILELLGVRHGMVALTKADLVDDETLELGPARGRGAPRRLGARRRRPSWSATRCRAGASTSVRDRARRGPGRRTRAARPRPAPPVDRPGRSRCKGAGTVVTGTLTGGPRRRRTTSCAAGSHPVRVRGIETAGQRLEAVAPGARSR